MNEAPYKLHHVYVVCEMDNKEVQMVGPDEEEFWIMNTLCFL